MCSLLLAVKMLALAMEFSRIAVHARTEDLSLVSSDGFPMFMRRAAEETLPQSCTGCPPSNGVLRPGHASTTVLLESTDGHASP